MTTEEDARLQWGKDVIAHVHREQTRWGRMYDPAKDRKYTTKDIVDAAGLLLIVVDERPAITQEELTLVKRQLTASKARETKAQNKVNALRAQVGELEELVEELQDEISRSE